MSTTPPAISPETLQRFDVAGPRYTSYPTADRFVDFDGEQLRERLRRRALDANRPLSVYVHIPFCASLCYYCGCNKIITRHHEQAVPYLEALEEEMALYAAEMGGARRVSQLHLGGGTPTFLDDEQLERLLGSLRTCFDIVPGAEMSIEIDPRTVTRQRLECLHAMGFNRLSYGVQDFDPRVQEAVHRIQPHDMVRDLMHAARDIGFESINVDLIYGLPMQTPESFARTIQQVNALRPDRVAMYAYAHLPTRFKPQRRIHEQDLPSAPERVQMLSGAIEAFIAHGYDYIGMDHFALPTDSLGVAKRQGRLHRNFQGYSTQPDCDLVGLGVSAIGQMGDCYAQNAKTLPEYYEALQQQRLPITRGVVLSRDDMLRREVIMELMCQGRLDFERLRERHGIEAERHFAPELDRLRGLASQGLVRVDGRGVEVTPTGWFFVRAVAMVFDARLRASQEERRFSRIV